MTPADGDVGSALAHLAVTSSTSRRICCPSERLHQTTSMARRPGEPARLLDGADTFRPTRHQAPVVVQRRLHHASASWISSARRPTSGPLSEVAADEMPGAARGDRDHQRVPETSTSASAGSARQHRRHRTPS